MQAQELPPALATALAGAEAAYARRCAGSAAANARAARVMPGGNTRTSLWNDPFPLCVASGEGCRITDVDGHTYVDLLGEFTAGIYGHTPPELAAAVAAAQADGINLSSHNTLESRLAELLVARFPSFDLVRFANSGTEANLMALATAKIVTGRDRIVVFEGGYHGGVLTFGDGGSPVNVPHDFAVLPYDDSDAATAYFASHGTSIAAVLVEPMLGAGGCRPASAAFLASLRRLTKDTGAILIFDEIQTSRMAYGGYQGRFGPCPDMTTIGKFFGGGLAFGAFGGRHDIMSRLDPRRPDAIGHAGTFNNNTLTMAAGIAAIETYLTADALDALFDRGETVRARLSTLFRDRQAPYSVSGLGSIMNIHGHGDRATDTALRRLMQFDLLEAGYYIAARGLIALSLPLGEGEISGFVDCVAAFLDRRSDALAAAHLRT
ncbi:aminotransferase class III-fold pyridoxal phosphate-dependent enzyme [Pseudooceanicola pacificus]|uniref:aminotransferase class III-fold pyridoxal phosphate-dependent enzyme n=1 Tax=Pseudooceanicola pacificus TaxID=2676438 RepID=UPI002E26D4A4